MGSWGVGLYSNDTAEEVRDMCSDIFPFLSVQDGNEIILNEYKDMLAMELMDDDYASFWYALADWQWNHGILCEEFRQKALKLLSEYVGIADWEESASKSDVRKRKAVLDKLKAKLESPMPEVKLPKKRLQKPKHKPGDIIIFKTDERDDYEAWEIVYGGSLDYYASLYIRENFYHHKKPFSAYEKYMAVLCVGSQKEPYSEYVPNVYNENSVYAYYDYCDDAMPTAEMLEQCGFLPNICCFNYNDEKRRFEEIKWTYKFTTISSFRANQACLIEVVKIKNSKEVSRFDHLLQQKPYSNQTGSWYLELRVAFHEIFEEKARLESLNMKIDNLLDPDVLNPEITLEHS